MGIPKFTDDLAIIQKLSDLPNSTEGLTADELKAQFDKAGLSIQKFINEQLVPSVKAREIPFDATNEILAANIYDAILSVQSQVRDAAEAVLVNGSVTKEKLGNQLLERVYGGRPWVSIDTPDSADNVAADFPVGQLWLRPRFTVTNVATTAWSGTGCNVAASGKNLTITGTKTVSSVKAVQTLANMGIAGDRVFVLFDVGSVDSEITGMTVNINSEGAKNARSGGVFETYLPGTSLTVQFDITWPSTSLAGGSAQIKNYAVVNTTQILRQMSETKDMGDWANYLRALQPISTHTSAAEMFIQTSSGQWWPFGFETLAVSRGGTGLNAVASGSLLVGTGGESLRALAPSTNGMFLQMANGQPAWTPVDYDAIVTSLGFVHYATGTYKGNASKRTITLDISPKIMWVFGPSEGLSNFSPAGPEQSISVMDGSKIGGSVRAETSGVTAGTAYVALNGNKLSFTVGDDDYKPKFMNVSGETYKWFALY